VFVVVALLRQVLDNLDFLPYGFSGVLEVVDNHEEEDLDGRELFVFLLLGFQQGLVLLLQQLDDEALLLVLQGRLCLPILGGGFLRAF